MAKQFDDRNRGSIWPNRKKQKDTHPDFTGQLNVEGTDYWVSAWKKKPDARDGAPSLSFSIKRKDDKPVQSEPRAEARRGSMKDSMDDMDDQIPF